MDGWPRGKSLIDQGDGQGEIRQGQLLIQAHRADLENDRIRSEYERGYKTVLEFFVKHL